MFGLGLPPTGTPKERRRYRVKWRVDGRDRTRALKTRAEADRLRTQLQQAVMDGAEFDLATGLPRAWVQPHVTWWSWSREWLALKWPQWSGHSRRSAVEALVAVTPSLVVPGAPSPPPNLAAWLREVGFDPSGRATGPGAAWLERWSVRLDQLDPSLLESALTTATTKRDGTMVSPDVARRRRNSTNAVLRAAVRRGLVERNPMDRVEWRVPQRNLAVDISTVPSFPDVCAIVELVAALRRGGARYAALFACVGMAGLRPSEAAAISVADLHLPTSGWGLVRLRGAVTSPGTRYTADGNVREAKALKHRAAGAIREVPLPPDLVERLCRHLNAWPSVDGRLFANNEGLPPASDNYGPVWVRARQQLWPAGHPLAKSTVYDLRHSAATTMLRAGVMPSEVARRLGHSVDILMRVYAGVLDDERDRSNLLIEDEIRRQRSATAPISP